MTTTAQLRNRYARDSVTTASPAQLLTMLFDRLLKDLTVAERAVGVCDVQGSHAALMHAQDIIGELRATLNTSTWREGEALLALYDWAIDELVLANMEKSAVHIQNARVVIEPIGEAFRQAASLAAAGA